MKRVSGIFFVLLCIPFLCGMGALVAEDVPGKIPVPESKYSIVFIDQMNIITECKDASIRGNTFIEGRRGEGIYTIPFADIENILFLLKDESLMGHVKLKDGEKVELLLNEDDKAYGNTKYGTYKIKLSNLKKMIINHQDIQN